MKKGINHLGSVIREEIQRTAKSPLVLDFGIIQEDYSLLTNTLTAKKGRTATGWLLRKQK